MSKMHQMMQIKSLGRIEGDWVIWENYAENKAKRAEKQGIDDKKSKNYETQGIVDNKPLVSLVTPTPTRSQSPSTSTLNSEL